MYSLSFLRPIYLLVRRDAAVLIAMHAIISRSSLPASAVAEQAVEYADMALSQIPLPEKPQ